MSPATRRKLFTLWFALGHPPFCACAVIISVFTSFYLGALTIAILSFWIWKSFRTTCRRCAYYGTNKCGLPGMIVPYLFARTAPASITPAQVQRHHVLDLSVFAYLNAIYCLESWLLPVALLWTAGVWMISFGPKRYHGLLYRLREDESSNDARRISLRMLNMNMEQGDEEV
ncbi:MAG TPA: hypothetical protein VE988_18780 [Gemmataceae bacterium]|nr:hypothetical protein [Gemmataceae bacterium]